MVDPTDKYSKQNNKVKRLMIPYKFKYFKSDVSLEVSVAQENTDYSSRSTQIAVVRGGLKNSTHDKKEGKSFDEDISNYLPLFQCSIQFGSLMLRKGEGFRP